MSAGSNLLLGLTGFIGALAAFLEADYCFPFFLFKISFYLFFFYLKPALGSLSFCYNLLCGVTSSSPRSCTDSGKFYQVGKEHFLLVRDRKKGRGVDLDIAIIPLVL